MAGISGHQLGDCCVALIAGDSQEPMRVAREHDRLVGDDALRGIVDVTDRARQHDGTLLALPGAGQHDVLLQHPRVREDRGPRLEGVNAIDGDATEEVLPEALKVGSVRERARGNRDELTAGQRGRRRQAS